MALNYLLTPCDIDQPIIVIDQSQLSVQIELGQIICIYSELTRSNCYTVTFTEDPITSIVNYSVDGIYNNCEDCIINCGITTNNLIVTECSNTSNTFVIPFGNFSGTLLNDVAFVCVATGPYESTCYRLNPTEAPLTSQETITPLNQYSSCSDCASDCFHKFYVLVDCASGKEYINSVGNVLQLVYDGALSTTVTANGGIDWLQSIVITNAYNNAGFEVAKGCLKLVETTYSEGALYYDIEITIDTLSTVSNCIQCKSRDCGDCDTLYTENVNCRYGDAVYAQMISKRYGLETCCDEDSQKWDIKKELVDLTNIKNTYIECCETAGSCSTCGDNACGCQNKSCSIN
jgi:hypothetical protein